MKNYIYILLVIMALSSCYHTQVIELSGERATREFSFNPTCESLSVFNTFDVILDESIPQGIAIIETDAAVMEHVKVKSREDNLSINLYEVELSATGVSSIKAHELECREAEVRATGTSTISVCATEKLTGSNIGVSTIHYVGNPLEISVQNVGMSSIQQKVCQRLKKERRRQATILQYVAARRPVPRYHFATTGGVLSC